MGPESIIVEGVDPRIVYREKDKTHYLTADVQPYETVREQPRRLWCVIRGSITDLCMVADCTTCKRGASLLIRDDSEDGVHYAFVATSSISAALNYATSTDMINWKLKGFWQGGRPGRWDAHVLAAGPQPMKLSTGDYVYFYNTDAGVGAFTRCRVMSVGLDDP